MQRSEGFVTSFFPNALRSLKNVRMGGYNNEELHSDFWTKSTLTSFIGLLLALTKLIKLWVASDDFRSTSFHDIFHFKALLKTMLLLCLCRFCLTWLFSHFPERAFQVREKVLAAANWGSGNYLIVKENYIAEQINPHVNIVFCQFC